MELAANHVRSQSSRQRSESAANHISRPKSSQPITFPTPAHTAHQNPPTSELTSQSHAPTSELAANHIPRPRSSKPIVPLPANGLQRCQPRAPTSELALNPILQQRSSQPIASPQHGAQVQSITHPDHKARSQLHHHAFTPLDSRARVANQMLRPRSSQPIAHGASEQSQSQPSTKELSANPIPRPRTGSQQSQIPAQASAANFIPPSRSSQPITSPDRGQAPSQSHQQEDICIPIGQKAKQYKTPVLD